MQSKLKVQDMTCSHCEITIKKAVSNMEGVKKVLVDLKNKIVTVDHDDKISLGKIKSNIVEIGYNVE